MMKVKRKIFVPLCIALVLVIAIFVIKFTASTKNTKPKQKIKKQPPCKSQLCVREAVEISAKLNESVDPCEDFYNFVCGGHNSRLRIGTDQIETGIVNNHEDFILRTLNTHLRQPEDPDEPNVFKYMKRFYNDCSDLGLLEEKGEESLKSVFAEAGGFPLLDPNWDEEKFSLENITLKFWELGLNTRYLFQMYFVPGSSNESYSVLELTHPSNMYMSDRPEKTSLFFVPSEYVERDSNKEIMQQYKVFLKDVMELLGANTSDTDEQLQDVIDLQIKLINNFLNIEESMIFYNMSLAELQLKYDWLDWKRYLKTQASLTLFYDDYEPFDDNYKIIISHNEYFDGLNELLKSTSKRTLANYFFIAAYLDAIDFMGTNFRNRAEQFREIIDGQIINEERGTYCAKLIKKRFSFFVSPFLLQKELQYQLTLESTKPTIQEMIHNLKKSMTAYIQNAEWIQTDSKFEYFEKVKSMESKIGYPDELFNKTFLDEYFEKLTTVPGDSYGDPYKSFLAMNKFREIKDLYTISVDNADFWEYMKFVFEVHTISSRINLIIIPMGIIQTTFMNPERPSYINYGALGVEISFVISAMFHYEGSNSSSSNIQECLINQINSTEDEQTKAQLRVDANSHVILMDILSVKMAYNAYKIYTTEHGVEQRLQNCKIKKYTPEQVFWIRMGQLWCSKLTDEAQKIVIALSLFPPDSYRVIFPVMYNDDFAKDFNCKPGTPMNPMDKCSI